MCYITTRPFSIISLSFPGYCPIDYTNIHPVSINSTCSFNITRKLVFTPFNLCPNSKDSVAIRHSCFHVILLQIIYCFYTRLQFSYRMLLETILKNHRSSPKSGLTAYKQDTWVLPHVLLTVHSVGNKPDAHTE